MDETTDAVASLPGHPHLTVREIRGLLTKHARNLVLSMRAADASPMGEEAHPMSFREFARLMAPTLKMN